jgi:hypothetical protein
MRKAVTAALSAAAFMVAPAVAGAQTIHIVNTAHLPARSIARFEAAAGQVANGSLRAHWGSPSVQWTRGGASMTLVLVPNIGPVAARCGADAAACHGVLGNGEPVAVVDTNPADTGVPWTLAASHELFEMLVDPFAQTTTLATDGSGREWLDEVADPVEDYSHSVRGVVVSDFVYPAWFRNTTGRQDAMGWLDDASAGTQQFEFSCPTGYGQYLDPYLGGHAMGPGITQTCLGSMNPRKRQRIQMHMGLGAHRDRSFVIGRPLKIKPWWSTAGRTTGS